MLDGELVDLTTEERRNRRLVDTQNLGGGLS